jgi:hypothetical protein
MKRNFLALCSVLGIALFFTSCSKNEAETNASLMIVNASPNGSNVDAAVNGSVIVNNLAYPSNSGYKTVGSGPNNVTVTSTGSSTAFINGTLTMEAGSYYSLYVTDSSHERKEAITRDDLTPPAAGKAKIRILHLSPNTPALDITITGSGTSSVNMTGRSFNDIKTNASYAAFQEVDAAGLSVQLKLAGTTTAVATIPVPALTAGKIYTFIIKGFTGATGSAALGLEVIQHN